MMMLVGVCDMAKSGHLQMREITTPEYNTVFTLESIILPILIATKVTHTLLMFCAAKFWLALDRKIEMRSGMRSRTGVHVFV